MKTTPDDLFERLSTLGLETKTVSHDPVFTVEESQTLRGTIPGLHCKSLFLKDKKGGLWLLVAEETQQINLRQIAKAVGAGNFSFAKPELLLETLGVTPGSVTPFALINDADNHVNVVVDAAMIQADLLNYHPLVNTHTTSISGQDLHSFIVACGHQPYIIDLNNPATE